MVVCCLVVSSCLFLLFVAISLGGKVDHKNPSPLITLAVSPLVRNVMQSYEG